MAIKKIEVSNFKSFKELDIELGKLNVLIGANASGKSNFVQLFRFIRDMEDFSLENAISMQGGQEYLTNINIQSAQDFSVKFATDATLQFVVNDNLGIKQYEEIYAFSIKFTGKGGKLKIVNDMLTQKYKLVKLLMKGKKVIKEQEQSREGHINISRSRGKVRLESNLSTVAKVDETRILPLRFFELLKETPPPSSSLLFESLSYFPALRMIYDNVSVYDFDPKLSKKASRITGKAELEEDGRNLTVVLKKILANDETERKFSNLIKDLLPFIERLDVQRIADKSLLLRLREVYFKKQYLPAFLISDGTINIAALIVALYFEEKAITIIEEPERNIHPSLIAKVMVMMKEASEKKQILVTTHNPETLKYVDLKDVLLVSRDKRGFSTISRPKDKKQMHIFLKNKMGIKNLYVQKLLEKMV